ncbi:hypothetical protein D5086_008216 [Populus alba]|uniref:Uncharacterized protein n=1 Tax=Populus alba TaxID=43335 RepID=A0ACC4CEN0_POPAL
MHTISRNEPKLEKSKDCLSSVLSGPIYRIASYTRDCACDELLQIINLKCSLSHQLPTEELPSNASILSILPFAFCSSDEQFQGSPVLIYSSKKSLEFYM